MTGRAVDERIRVVTNRMTNSGNAKAAALRTDARTLPRQRRAMGGGPDRGRLLTTKTGLRIPAAMAFEDWEQAGRQLSGILDSSSWWLGDWLVYGKDHYTDRCQRGIRAVGLRYQTLRNYAWVSRRFEFNRRRAALSFQHHAELTSLPVDEQEAWLDRAERMKWSAKQLRTALRASREAGDGAGAEAGHEKRAGAVGRPAVPRGRIPWWHEAAERSGIELEQWVLTTLDRAAERVLGERGHREIDGAATAPPPRGRSGLAPGRPAGAGRELSTGA
ncbi:LmbU family transcriptional regulator [Streptomyces sp. IB2014 016-6]|uniref:LmbU family transcriptional regulator n=1 Tax=Streptomyces sp. IB2014 016-6 TaxID=2517818 RepID=UPI0032202CE2